MALATIRAGFEEMSQREIETGDILRAHLGCDATRRARTMMVAIAAVVASTMSSPALAGDRVMDPATVWAGAYAGVQIGAVFSDMQIQAPAVDPISVKGDLGSWSPSGGAVLGYNFMLSDSFVFGVQTDLLINPVEDVASIDIGPVTAVADLEMEHLVSVSVRAGYLFDLHTLAYVIGGYSTANLSGPIGVANVQGATVTMMDQTTFDGFHVGAGIERQVSDSLSVRAEYRYTDLDGAELAGGLVGVSTELHSVMFGLNWNFQNHR